VKLLIDQNLDRRTSALLRALGHDAQNAGELGLSTAPDQVILDLAVGQGRVIATMDSDFHVMIATRRLALPSTILIRVHSPKATLACELIHSVCNRFSEQLFRGCLVTVDGESARVRDLPITFSR
jgi:predicted nuclease of predicted toxin-antitoxin system